MHLSPAAIEGAIRLSDQPNPRYGRGDILETGEIDAANLSGWNNLNGGGGGSRTRVRKCVPAGLYMRVRFHVLNPSAR